MPFLNLVRRHCPILLILLCAFPLFAAGDLAEYTGTYQVDKTTSLILRVEDAKLLGELPNRPVFQLKATETDRFEVVNIPVKLVFLRDRTGEIYALELRQPLSDTIAPRTKSTPKLTLDEAHLKRCVGRYVVDGLNIVMIRFENGGLTYNPLGPDRYKLIPKSKTLFHVEGKPEQLEFQFEGSGPPASVIINFGKHKRKFIRTAM